ncbi:MULTISPECIES: phosphatidate cytidylyltransferase [Dyella]|uniref:Phosphatidate cytidylyltransferase n=2 Tax=Dyella TaxID=231454 RepID=A0A4R0YW82_9GAMM|nr:MULTISPECIES: phosphatidate cytidylyltransferase [Dyella]TBR38757.1 phosphatidate cytidylyltransferase [Dyella terrae]TCI13652.1 phosphatidate cytidylyltransferase [Dyella soli]
MLLQRTITALLLAPLAILMILWPPTGVFALIGAAAFLAAMWEWTRLAGLKDYAVRGGLLALTAAIFAGLWVMRGNALWPILLGVGVAWWAVVCLWLRHFAFGAAPTRENQMLKLGAGALVIIPAWVAALTIHGSQPYGHWWMFLALAIVWCADIGAYFSGRAFGRRKLAPTISPGKTWAGVYGAFVAGALCAGIGGWLLDVRGGALAGLLVLSAVTVVASIIGDLLESLMKRHAAVKDSGNLFPGHGGLLDRLDSVFAALPVFAAGKLLLGL